MKKTHRSLLSILLVLTLLASLPMTALAEGETHIESDQPTNTESSVIVDAGVTVGTNTGDNVTNNGTIETNNGIIETNNGTVGAQNGSSAVEGTGNYGTIGENNGFIVVNYGTVKENTEQSSMGNNFGTVEVNSGLIIGTGFGTVEVNEVCGIIESDGGVWSENPEDLHVKTNYGTVTYYGGGNTHCPAYGVHCLDEKGEKVYLGQYLTGSEVQIDNLKRDGYKLVGCEAVEVYYGNMTENGPVFNDVTDRSYVTKNEDGTVSSFKIYRPTRLTMIWEKLASAIKPASGSQGTSYNPNYIGLGSVVSINGSRFKVVEIKDDAYVVVSFFALPDEDVKDLNALFASLFTPEQQKQIKNIGQLLDAEDVLTIFGKPGNHPVFEIQKDLVKK